MAYIAMAYIIMAGASLASVAQEFGTLPGVLVLSALRRENAEWHHSGGRRSADEATTAAMAVRDAFYCHESCSWMTAVISRGEAVWRQAAAAVSSS